jgi:hypothetical protein
MAFSTAVSRSSRVKGLGSTTLTPKRRAVAADRVRPRRDQQHRSLPAPLRRTDQRLRVTRVGHIDDHQVGPEAFLVVLRVGRADLHVEAGLTEPAAKQLANEIICLDNHDQPNA